MSIELITLEDIETMADDVKEIIDRHTPTLKIKYKDRNFPTMLITNKGDWIDLMAAEDYELKAGESVPIDLGIAMKCPEGFEAWLVPRSGTFKKYGLIQTNSIGIIDNSYSGNNDIWMMPVYATQDTKIAKGERLCQFRLMPNMNSIFDKFANFEMFACDDLYIIETEQLDDKDRGGFGSTGR